ncbi:unnamed protein product [Polarella glacialis]|uniref:EF-hand domain-containing protein n=1 Tax=Polarella glacialis TaxID=89957 RepID=A0A813F7C2_POLGL|nr:unnamed protein product [Polarella glacialis]
MGSFPKTPPDRFKQQASHIVQMKHSATLMNVEVDNWLLCYRLINSKHWEGREDPQERIHREEEFWSVYHRRAQASQPLRLDGNLGLPTSKAAKFSMEFGLDGKMKWRMKPQVGTVLRHVLEEEHLMENRSALAGDSRPKKAAPTASSAAAPLHVRKAERDARLSLLLPAVANRGFADKMLKPIMAGRLLYLEECERHHMNPTPSTFATGHSSLLEVSNKFMTDAELIALTKMLSDRPLEVANLENNSLLTDKALVPFLNELHEFPGCDKLHLLNLGHCESAGPPTAEAVIQLVNRASNLRTLDLSSVLLATRLQLQLCHAIGEHPALQTVSLVETGLGSTCITMDCVNKVLSSKHIEILDLSWNCFNHAVFRSMGERLIENKKLRKFTIDNCAALVIGRDTPVADFIECLVANETLTFLSLSTNRIDFRAALVLEEALDRHKCLRTLHVSENPMGVLGIRSLLRLVSRASNALVHFDFEGCHNGGNDAGGSEKVIGAQVYSYTNPGSRYSLNLARPYHRSLLRELYKCTDRFKLTFDQAFQQLTFSQPPYQHATKDARGMWQVTTSGTLEFLFNVQNQMEMTLTDVADDDFFTCLERHFQLTRFRPDPAKMSSLFSKWKELHGRDMELQAFLNALSKDFNLSVSEISYLCTHNKNFATRVMRTMLPTIVLDRRNRYLSCMNFPKISEFYSSWVHMEALLQLNIQNPSGHYKLNLASSSDFAVAQRLILLDRWEGLVNRRNGRIDISARNNGSHLRNEYHQGKALYPRISSIFEFDYMSSYRPPMDALPLSEALWSDLMIELYNSKCRQKDRIRVLSAISNLIFITSKLFRQLVGYFRDSINRMEAMLIFFLRIVDIHNSKVFLCRFTSEAEVARLRSRIGYTTLFPFIQPENAKFDLDLNYHDQRLCGAMLVDLCYKEKAGNIKDAEYIDTTGQVKVLTMGIPRSWASGMPVGGRFKCRYVCSPEDRKLDARKKFAETHGYLKCGHIKDKDVEWWTGLTEPPSDVLDLLEFFVSRVSDMDEAFRAIDGGAALQESGAGSAAANMSSNNEITLREFEAGVKAMGCEKFKGADENQRIASIFRYLDPGGEGSVSLREWQSLNQLFKEFVLSIKEFVQFLMFAFGEFLEDAWEVLDADGSGGLTEDEWFEALESIGYFGPARVVFALLDGTDDGDISWEEFKVLENYKPEVKKKMSNVKAEVEEPV